MAFGNAGVTWRLVLHGYCRWMIPLIHGSVMRHNGSG
jgi:hypothetical protein